VNRKEREGRNEGKNTRWARERHQIGSPKLQQLQNTQTLAMGGRT
jgi:hypothetical protein